MFVLLRNRCLFGSIPPIEKTILSRPLLPVIMNKTIGLDIVIRGILDADLIIIGSLHVVWNAHGVAYRKECVVPNSNPDHLCYQPPSTLSGLPHTGHLPPGGRSVFLNSIPQCPQVINGEVSAGRWCCSFPETTILSLASDAFCASSLRTSGVSDFLTALSMWSAMIRLAMRM